MALGCKAGRLEESGSRINRAMKLSSEHYTFVPSHGKSETFNRRTEQKRKKILKKRFNFRRRNNSSVEDALI